MHSYSYYYCNTKCYESGLSQIYSAFLNCINHDKTKTEDFSDDKPTQWTREIFAELFECIQSEFNCIFLH